jgi:hypothetical protein
MNLFASLELLLIHMSGHLFAVQVSSHLHTPAVPFCCENCDINFIWFFQIIWILLSSCPWSEFLLETISCYVVLIFARYNGLLFHLDSLYCRFRITTCCQLM